MKTPTQRREKPCLRGHTAQSVSPRSYSSPSASGKSLLFLHLKLSKGWYSSIRVIREVWERQWWRSWETTRWETLGWRMCEQQVAAVSLESWSRPWKPRSMCTTEGMGFMPVLCSLMCLSSFTHLLRSQVDCPTPIRAFPFLCSVSLRNRWGRLGNMTQKSFIMERLHLEN